MNIDEIKKEREALDSVRVKVDLRSEGIKIDLTPEEQDALLDLRNWVKNSNFDCPKCGQLLNKKREIDKNTNKQKGTFICPCCFKESNISELK